MKKRTKIICMALAAFFAFSALAASAQAADQWYTSATETGTFTTLPVGSNVTISGTSGISTLAVPKAGFTIECKEDTFTATIQNATTPVEAHITVAAGGLVFKKCQLKGTSTEVCQVRSAGKPNGEISVNNELTGKTNTTTGANLAHAIFTPTNAEEKFVEIEILGEECSVKQAGAIKVTGKVEGVLSPKGEVASQTATLEFPATALSGSTIKYGTNPATFVSTESAKTSGTWIKLHN